MENLIKPVFLLIIFARAERKADWPLHLLTTAGIIPYIFASGHLNYARYEPYYLRSIKKLSETILKEFLEGKHVIRHQPGLWNTIWSDQYIESTFMKYGHGPKGIIGKTLHPSTLKRWALGLHLYTQLQKDIKT